MKLKGSTACLIVMLVSVITYVAFQAWCYIKFQAFLPAEVTLGVFAVFGVEVWQLARFKLAKEGDLTKKDNERMNEANGFFQKMGMPVLPDLNVEINDEIERQENGKEIDQP